ncbi:MAG: ATP synthase F1 subunit gamma [Bacteroidia bacterium]|nr:ATP synthase F1 subunit gamma [Bacteroidia bacterium]MDW8347429.1 ATP synthase F1 subunit gamma [Bacteroidia bacterium]
MGNLKEIRNRIKAVKSTQQITKAMKMVAASKFKKAQDSITQIRPYVNKLQEILTNLSQNADAVEGSPYLVQRPVNKVLLVVITADRGLCGAFNSSIIKLTLQIIQEKYKIQYEKGNLHLVCVGKKGNDYFTRRNYKVVGQYPGIFQKISFDTAIPIVDKIMEDFAAEKYDLVEIVYNQFKNVITQLRISETFLPIQAEQILTQNTSKPKANTDYIFEPSPETIIKDLIPKSLKIRFYKALLDSNAAEQASRMTAMDTATENAAELLYQLNLNYNRARQASITTELTEIVSGAEALAAGE